MRIDIWSDVVCPWCYVGKRRLEAALARFAPRDAVEVVWRSFELDPSAPPSPDGRIDYAQRLAAKYGTSVADARAMIENMTGVAAADGLELRFDLLRPGNTFDAHRLLHLALRRGVQDDVKERLDRATFRDGLRVSHHDDLAQVAVDAGLDEGEVRAVLASDRFAGEVRADERRARAYGISAVPFFVVDGRYGVAGAQPSDLLLEVLTRAWDERAPLDVRPGSAPACDDGSCAVPERSS
ncbi:MAG TPA: DsbA family oxidoreductase [Actinomycetota bacterium]|nr:DsbA family oxidoreductase [Actinomycetota bacterium]